jgi:chromosome segregation ATPase
MGWKKLKFWRRRGVKKEKTLKNMEERLDELEQVDVVCRASAQERIAQLEHVEVILRARVRDLEKELVAEKNVKTILRSRLSDQDKELGQLKQVEATLHGAVSDLGKKLEAAEVTFSDWVSDLNKKLEEQRQVEATLRGCISDQDKKLDEQKQIEATLRERITELEDKCELHHGQCEELHISVTEPQFEKEIANIQFTEPANKDEEKDLKRKNVETYQNCVINEHCVRLQESKRNRTEVEADLKERIKEVNKNLIETNKEKKEEQSAPPGKMKKLVSVGVAVALATVMVVGSFITYSVNFGYVC